jgi:hypothetical protein
MKNPKWRQNNPADQMVATVAAISGDASNIADDSAVSPRKSAERIVDFCEELQELIKLLPSTEWPE